MILPISPLSQRDARWAKQRLGTVNGITIGSDGCIITDMAMLATYYGHPILPDQLDNILTDRNLYYDGDLFVNGSITKIFPDIVSDGATFCESTPAPIDAIKAYLDQGKPVVVALLNFGVRHYILVVGYEGNKLYANDPWQGDQVAVNDRWGDPTAKILQVNFFSGSVHSQPIVVPPVNLPPLTPPPVQTTSDQTMINLGGDLGYMEVQAIRSIINDLRNANTSLQNQLNTINSRDNAQLLPNLLPIQMPQKSVNQTFIDSLKSRKFILSIVASTIAFLNANLNLGLSQGQVITVISPLLAFIGVEGVADIVERNKAN